MNQFGLKTEVITQINQIFAQYPEISKAILYGSRAKGNYKNGYFYLQFIGSKDLLHFHQKWLGITYLNGLTNVDLALISYQMLNFKL